jgi:carbamoyltransferase
MLIKQLDHRLWKEILPKWHHLLESVKKNTGHAVILNTSFNVRGEPIVCTPYDAIKCFYSTNLDALAIEDILLIK